MLGHEDFCPASCQVRKQRRSLRWACHSPNPALDFYVHFIINAIDNGSEAEIVDEAIF